MIVLGAGAVKITKGGATMKKYSDLENRIWALEERVATLERGFTLLANWTPVLDKAIANLAEKMATHIETYIQHKAFSLILFGMVGKLLGREYDEEIKERFRACLEYLPDDVDKEEIREALKL